MPPRESKTRAASIAKSWRCNAQEARSFRSRTLIRVRDFVAARAKTVKKLYVHKTVSVQLNASVNRIVTTHYVIGRPYNGISSKGIIDTDGTAAVTHIDPCWINVDGEEFWTKAHLPALSLGQSCCGPSWLARTQASSFPVLPLATRVRDATMPQK